MYRAIKEKKQNDFAGVDADRLKLWRVNTDQTISEEILNDELEDTAKTIGNTFLDVQGGNIRVIVRAPDTAQPIAGIGSLTAGIKGMQLQASNTQSKFFGIIPYVDPKRFNGRRMKKDSAQFGEQYGVDLALEILQGLREEPIPNTPENYIKIYTECWNANNNTSSNTDDSLHGEIDSTFRKDILDYFSNYNIKSQEFYNWLLINQNNNSDYIFLLGYCNYNGIGTSVNKQKAVELFQQAANLSSTIGKWRIFRWYHMAANSGDSMAQYNLALMYKNGDNIDKDYSKAFELFKQSAEGKYPDGITMLAYCYHNGIGTRVNKQKAIELYRQAANLKNKGANIGYDKAFELCHKLNIILLICIMYGREIKKDVSRVIYWHEQSVKQGDKNVQYKLKKN
ncbi:hypothetical protein GLOIN_2v1767566 [Rhizophagus irregularis DAOM 181602=DAOM 197198]|uniref:HCP-like protein n=1 Tax=Rhizophagus irregularis (strain DAOM 181602 / DAOM 197198 / MUCL 43194) TaxID=747089 RepID=A0A2P4QJ99_RHIID|nr:hypothetical protein GLOIN_2v1767566 [Rhizophagus irregularis DAOM 181602=DAOM 197198]POG77729.1 hypothetical protein GLOIN_2v1767566 [Rhizophagus irregularis DAOM 181602=DAOM 197198]|eukprot:XP_025184595.1 hypothetical protein GLOIN_2v1767566 [Rhizophagus irregularis DAOM 181602=DAOM 197198]